MVRSVALLKLEAVGLRGAGELRPDELSGGMAGVSLWLAVWLWIRP